MNRFAWLLPAALSFAAPQAASAAQIVNITSYSFPSGSNTGTLHFTGSPFNNQNVAIGQFRLTGTEVGTNAAASFLTFCVDIFHALTVPGKFEVTSLSQMYTGTRATNINKILANTSVTNATQSAAVQLALWEVAFETGPSFNVNSGAFWVNNGNSGAARTLANSYLSNLGSWNVSTTHIARLLYDPKRQSQVFLAPVPEPATWAMMLLGFGLIGFAMRTRKGRTAVSFA